jgi:hypothetical protein
MKKILYSALLGLGFIGASCDHVENPFPPAVNVDLDTTIYPGNWSDYVANEWPDFALLPNDNPDRNALIEDYTGHNCTACPAAGTVAHALHEANPTRVLVSSVHSSPEGMSSFQAILAPNFLIDFTNENALDLGYYFGMTLSNSGFFGNPAGTVNRTNDAGEYFSGSGNWSTRVGNILASPLKVVIKAKLNYEKHPRHPDKILMKKFRKIEADIEITIDGEVFRRQGVIWYNGAHYKYYLYSENGKDIERLYNDDSVINKRYITQISEQLELLNKGLIYLYRRITNNHSKKIEVGFVLTEKLK